MLTCYQWYLAFEWFVLAYAYTCLIRVVYFTAFTLLWFFFSLYNKSPVRWNCFLHAGRCDNWLLCSEEWKKFDCSCNGVQGQENWAVSLYCSRYILQHAHCQDMKLWFNKFEFGYLSLNLYLLMSFVKNPIKFYISSEYWKLGTYAMS